MYESPNLHTETLILGHVMELGSMGLRDAVELVGTLRVVRVKYEFNVPKRLAEEMVSSIARNENASLCHGVVYPMPSQ